MIRRPRMHKDRYGYTIIDGHTYLGKQRIPPMPVHIIMEDRVSGVQRSLSHMGNPGSLELDLITPDPRWPDTATFGPFAGPYVGNWRLYLASDVLTAEAMDPRNPHANLRVLTRKDFERTMLEITVAANGTILYDEFAI